MRYSVESKVSFSHEEDNQLVSILQEHGSINFVTGGFPVSPLIYDWEGSEEGVSKAELLGAEVTAVRGGRRL